MIYDITPELDKNFPVWPGDVFLSRQILSEIKAGDRTTNSAFTASAHLGAHADAPSHYMKGGETIDQRDLSYYLGPCQVIRWIGSKKPIHVEEVKQIILAERILFATDSYLVGEPVENGFASLSAELIDYLNHKGVITVGIDTPSIDAYESEQLLSHQACGKNNMAILENLDLALVPEGIYELIALPLKLKGFDASPVRAILTPVRL